MVRWHKDEADMSRKCHASAVGGTHLDAAERFMVRWHKDEADMSRKRHASTVGGAQGNGKGGSYSPKETAVDESRKETADRVARYQAEH